MTCDRCLDGLHHRCRNPSTCSCTNCAKNRVAIETVKAPPRRRPIVGAFDDEYRRVHIDEHHKRLPFPRIPIPECDDRIERIMRITGASETEINEALGVHLCYATISEGPGRSRLVRPDVRVAQLMRQNGAFTKEIAAAIRVSVSCVEQWLHNQHRWVMAT